MSLQNTSFTQRAVTTVKYVAVIIFLISFTVYMGTVINLQTCSENNTVIENTSCNVLYITNRLIYGGELFSLNCTQLKELQYFISRNVNCPIGKARLIGHKSCHYIIMHNRNTFFCCSRNAVFQSLSIENIKYTYADVNKISNMLSNII